MPSPDETPTQATVITGASTRDEVAQILYGLSIRGVRASFIDNPSKDQPSSVPGAKPDRFLVVLDSDKPIQRQIADESIEAIWDAILEQCPRAVTPSGHCSFCGYDLSRLPRPTVCPECGVDVDSIEARRVVWNRRS
ncbi:MAG: hypothetical protein KDA29_02065 [Phycisphaerales bacterium]|nr:hypothetical protein [Phycisphaerales bacterium]